MSVSRSSSLAGCRSRLAVGGATGKVTAASSTIPRKVRGYAACASDVRSSIRAMTADERREELKALFGVAKDCTRCPQLAATRTTVVFGAGNADADLMFVGEAPGANEDKQGLPFVGQAGRLLDTLLGEIGLARADVFIQNTVMCRPPGNRHPQPGAIQDSSGYLLPEIQLVQP